MFKLIDDWKIRSCIKKGDLQGVQKLIEKRPDLINSRVMSGKSFIPLHEAVYHGQKSIAEFLIEKGSDVNAADRGGNTPLFVAVRKDAEYLRDSKRPGLVNLLICKGANVNARDIGSHTPLHFAAQGCFNNLAELLIDNGADIEAKELDGGTPLHEAALSNCKDAVQLLINRGANVNAKGRLGHTPLHFASGKGFLDVVQILITNGADINANAEGDANTTPLRESIRRGHKNVSEFLRKRNAKEI